MRFRGESERAGHDLTPLINPANSLRSTSSGNRFRLNLNAVTSAARLCISNNVFCEVIESASESSLAARYETRGYAEYPINRQLSPMIDVGSIHEARIDSRVEPA
jgi:hypothetical protein